MLSERLFPTTKKNPCPICGNESGKCRTKDNEEQAVLCAGSGFARKFDREGLYICVNHSGKGHTSHTWVLAKEGFDSWDDARKEAYFKEKVRWAAAAEKARQEAIDREMSALDRNRWGLKVLSELQLLDKDHEQLDTQRNLPIEVIKRICFRSVTQWQKISFQCPDNYPGYNPAKQSLICQEGMIAPIRQEGVIVGFENRLDNHGEGEGRYRVVSCQTSSIHLMGELPLGVYHSKKVDQGKGIWVIEGRAWKPQIANELFDIPVLAGGRCWHNSQNHADKFLPKFREIYGNKIILTPDAGDVVNIDSVPEKWIEEYKFFESQGFDVSFAWWEQITKDGKDIDELEDLSIINFISLDEFEELIKKYNPKYNSPQTMEELNAKIEPSKPAQNQEKISQFQELKAIRHGLINITEVPYKVVNVPHLEQTLKDVIEPGTINIIVSDTGTGKTESIIPFAKKADAFYSWHNRISLGQAIAKKLELDYKDPKSKTNLSNKKKAAFCAPSAYQFDPKHLSKHEGILLVDEADQVFDFLFGSLCNKDGLRPLLLSTLEAHVKSAIYGQGLCLFMSADITQKEIDLIKSLAPENTPVRLIVNKYQPQRPDINFDVSESPEGLLSELIAKLDDGVPCFVLDDMKNGVKGCKSLAEYVRKQFPELKDLILEIHADSQHDPKVKAFNEDPDEESKKYIMIICSPSIISGVSLKNQKFINGVFGFCNGILMDREIKQFLNRVRGAKDIYLWVSQDGFEPMGIPSELVNPDEIASYYQRNYEGNAKHLLSYKPEYEVMSGEWSSPYFKLFCKNQSYRSITAKFLRRFTKEHLLELGYGINEISFIPEGGTEEVKNALTTVWNNIEIKEALAIEAAEILPDSVMDALDFDVEIPSDMLPSYRKTKMLRTFGEELINATVFTHKKTGREFTGYAAMALKNARGEYQRHLDNFFLLSKPIEESKERDYKAESRQQKHGERFAGDVRWNARKRKCREFLGLHEFINPETIDKWLDPNDFAELASKAKNYPDQVREVLNLDVSKISPGQIFGQLMDQIGLGLDKKSVAGQKYKLRRINKQDYEYVQMYLTHKESLELGKVASIEPVAVVEQVAVAETSEDPLIPLIVDGFQSIKTIDEWDSINADITEAQMQSAWDALTQDVRDRISNLFIENRHEAHT